MNRGDPNYYSMQNMDLNHGGPSPRPTSAGPRDPQDDLDKFVSGAVKEAGVLALTVRTMNPEELKQRLMALRDNLSHVEGTLQERGVI